MADECILPEEILHYIFLRMPTKPLLQLKCLSKHWNCVISNPSFMKARSRRMILAPALPLHAIDISVQGNDMNHSMIKLHFPYAMLEDKEVTIVGSFNGIVLLVLEKAYRPHELILYNPFTGAFKTVPRPPYSDYTNHVYGFGYGTILDDLKIIRIMRYDSANSGSRLYEIFSLKSGSWSSPSVLIGKYHFLKYSGTFVNGFLYWVAARDDHWPIIVALDIKKMVFSEILIPSGCKWNCLGRFNGRLSMICIRSNDFELWVTNDHDSGNLWSKKCSSKYTSLSDHDKSFNVLCVLDDGELLVVQYPSKQLIVYDMFKESYKEVNTLISFGQLTNLQSIEYLESSISPADMCSTLI